MQFAGIKGQAQRLARTKQMGLSDDVGKGVRAQALCQRGVGIVTRKLWGVGLKQVGGAHVREIIPQNPGAVAGGADAVTRR